MIGSMGIGAGANLVGGTMQSIAASQAAKAMGKETERELQRQQGFRNEGFDRWQTGATEQSAEAATADIQKGADIRRALSDFVSGLSMGVGHAGAQGRDMANLKLKGSARAALGGYNDWALDRMIRQIRTQNDLNKISNFAAGTASVFPYRMHDAQHSWDELAFWGQLISSLGGSAGDYSQLFGAGGSPAAGGAPGAPGPSPGPWASGYQFPEN